LAVIPGAGHLANLEQPETFTRIVRSFASDLVEKRL
jgi:pimeloyl-ACP methyl ester carboxylesterase